MNKEIEKAVELIDEARYNLQRQKNILVNIAYDSVYKLDKQKWTVLFSQNSVVFQNTKLIKEIVKVNWPEASDVQTNEYGKVCFNLAGFSIQISTKTGDVYILGEYEGDMTLEYAEKLANVCKDFHWFDEHFPIKLNGKIVEEDDIFSFAQEEV